MTEKGNFPYPAEVGDVDMVVLIKRQWRNSMTRIIFKIAKCTTFLLGIVLLVGCLRLPVYADIWIDPMETDEFLSTHTNSSYFAGCTYITNGKEGYVPVYRSPEDLTVIAKIENNKEDCYGYYYYEDENNAWCSYDTYDGYPIGWVRESDLILVYDYRAFDHFYHEKVKFHGGEKDFKIDADFAYVYEYPGAPEPKDKTGKSSIHCYGYYTYRDEKGRKWINGEAEWICIDNPTALPEELYPDGLPEMRSTSEFRGPVNWLPIIITASLVAGVAAVTGILLLFIYRKNKSKKNNSGEES